MAGSSSSNTSTPRTQSRAAWTPDEEKIWREAAERVLKRHLLDEVRQTGKLGHRKGSLNAHLKAFPTKPAKAPRAWTPDEEAHFKAKALMILKRDLWAEIKDHPGIKVRQSSGVKAHIDAMFKKL
ncbi:uncharacterized protein LOC62_03G004371 [Vanrija pseudolonga]|uniref:Myb-like domain-containing protein n=1 Tax=Vanrija pseudolonga TaxID=143232 RepID=A0AAF0YC09_9TREE|nr:hypothetical protein LOC62_03G004371 [Vanrija pseudolonga]